MRVRARTFLVLGVTVLAFMLGLILAEFRLFPSRTVHEAAEAARDWARNWRHYLQIRS